MKVKYRWTFMIPTVIMMLLGGLRHFLDFKFEYSDFDISGYFEWLVTVSVQISLYKFLLYCIELVPCLLFMFYISNRDRIRKAEADRIVFSGIFGSLALVNLVGFIVLCGKAPAIMQAITVTGVFVLALASVKYSKNHNKYMQSITAVWLFVELLLLILEFERLSSWVPGVGIGQYGIYIILLLFMFLGKIAFSIEIFIFLIRNNTDMLFPQTSYEVLESLKDGFDKGEISQEEYAEKKSEILSFI